MSDAEIQYARADDGCFLACRVTGDGPLDLIETGSYGTFFPLDASDEQPQWNRFETRLGRFCRLIRFDLRGIGLSDRGTDDLSIGRRAADHPHRITHTILANTGARFLRADDPVCRRPFSTGASRNSVPPESSSTPRPATTSRRSGTNS